MTRFSAAILLAVALVAGTPAAGQTLRPAATVVGNVVHLGDLFDAVGAQTGETVIAAPPPGMRVTYGADWLAATARAHNLAWTPRSPFDQVTIERASRTIEGDAIIQSLMHEIASREPVEDAELELDNAGPRFVVGAEDTQGVAIDGLTIDQRSGRVSAYVSAPAGDPSAQRRRVTGHLVHRIDVPVLTHAMAPGTTIAADDIETAKTRRERLGSDVVTDMQFLIGKTPRRPLQPGTPVRLGDVERPLLVHKGELVTILFETMNLHITAQGKALDDGAKDASIRAQNTKSGRIVDTIVIASGAVSVKGNPALALALHTAER